MCEAHDHTTTTHLRYYTPLVRVSGPVRWAQLVSPTLAVPKLLLPSAIAMYFLMHCTCQMALHRESGLCAWSAEDSRRRCALAVVGRLRGRDKAVSGR